MNQIDLVYNVLLTGDECIELEYTKFKDTFYLDHNNIVDLNSFAMIM